MTDDATRIIALERLLQHRQEKHKKEVDRLQKRIRRLEAELRNKTRTDAVATQVVLPHPHQLYPWSGH